MWAFWYLYDLWQLPHFVIGPDGRWIYDLSSDQDYLTNT